MFYTPTPYNCKTTEEMFLLNLSKVKVFPHALLAVYSTSWRHQRNHYMMASGRSCQGDLAPLGTSCINGVCLWDLCYLFQYTFGIEYTIYILLVLWVQHPYVLQSFQRSSWLLLYVHYLVETCSRFRSFSLKIANLNYTPRYLVTDKQLTHLTGTNLEKSTLHVHGTVLGLVFLGYTSRPAGAHWCSSYQTVTMVIPMCIASCPKTCRPP